MSVEPWPPLHRRPEFRKRLIRVMILGPLLVIIAINLFKSGGG